MKLRKRINQQNDSIDRQMFAIFATLVQILSFSLPKLSAFERRQMQETEAESKKYCKKL